MGSGGGNTAAETVKIEYSGDGFATSALTATSSVASPSSTSTMRSFSWTVPSPTAICGTSSCTNVKIRISTNNDGNYTSVTSEQPFTVTSGAGTGFSYGGSFVNSDFYSLSDSVYTPFSGGSVSLPAPITWTRRKPITITNGTASNLTDFQVSIPVTYDADMQSNFNDLRFTASDGTTLLNYWIESKVNGSSATVWVQVPSVPASSSATIYMYFGNSTVASASSISNTFLFGDDFSGSLDTTKWTVVGNPVNTAGGIFTASSSNSGIWATNYALTGSAIIETLVQKGSSSYGRVSFVNAASRFKQGMTNGDRGFDYLMYSGSLYGQTADTTGQQETYFGSYGTAYHRVKMVFTSGSSVGWYDTVPGSGTTISTSLGNSGLDYIPEPADDLHPEIYNYSGTMQNDWIFVRQFASADPSVSVGVKQTVSTNLGSPSSDPSITFLSGHSFTNASSFTASTTGPVKFQFSNNNGSSWKYCVGNTPTDATNSSSQASWASEITNACLANLPPGTMSVRSYLVLPTSTPQSSIDYVGVALSNSVNSMPVSTSTTGITTSSITYSWSSGGGDETYYTVEQSTDGYTFTSVATTSLATPSYTFTGLSTNTPYWFRVAGADGRAATSSYATSSRVYTLAATPNRVAGVSALSETSISVQIDTNTLNGNSADTTRFIIKDSGSLTPTYLQSDGTWSTALAILTYAQLGAGTLTTTGLLPNTLHTVSVAALNPDGATTPYSEGLSVYTLANVPGAPSVTNATTSTMDITIATNNNPATTQYAIYNATGGNYLATSGFSNGTTAVWQTRASWGTGFTARGLSSDTAYQFQIYARNGDGVVATVSSLSASLSTNGINNPSLSPVTSEIGTGSIRLDWTAGGGDETYYILEKSRDGILYDVVATVPKGTEYYTFTGLSVNTQYWFRLASGNGVDPDSAYVVATPAFTAAALPGPLTTLSATATTTLSFTIGSATINGNPTGSETTYIVRDSAGVTNQYLQNDGTWGSSPVAFTYAQLGSGAVVQTTGLSPNSQHAISLAAVNGDGMQTSFGETRNIYTLASTPWSVALRINTDNTALLSWLGDATDYQVSGTRNVDWANDLFAIVRNVECDTSLHFQVKGRNADGVETAFSNTVFGVTNPCGGWSVWRPPANANPVAQEQDVTNATSTIDDQLVPKATEITLKSDVSLSVGQSALVAIGAETHTITINNANPESVTITLHSDPITATLKLNVPQDFDTDGDGIPDVRGLYTGIVNGKTQIIFTAIPSIPAGIATSTVPVATPSSTPATTPATGSLVPIVAVPDYMFTSLLKRGSVGPEVIELQKRLKQEGFFPQAIDFAPSFGAITEFSLKTYQQARNLTPTGVLDTATRQTLNGDTKTIKVVPVSDRYFFTQTVRRGSQGLEVLQLQTLLQSLGFFPRSTTKTNFFGPVTQTSLSSFQTANDTADEQDVRGPYTGPKTRAKLNSIE
jgi:peptidoglycan hydrolase-like protein with peptidoglycan-binding domain